MGSRTARPIPAAGVAVSYTHLFTPGAQACEKAGTGAIKTTTKCTRTHTAVSYTHLDVYKRQLWALVLVSGVSSTCWKVTATTTLAQILMCHKVTHKKLIDNSPLFREVDNTPHCETCADVYKRQVWRSQMWIIHAGISPHK